MTSEDDLIATYFRPLATDAGAFGLIDDAALIASSGDDIVVTTDAIVEGVHYLADDPPDTIARKALRVNLSDLAAKGATPAGFVLTLALRKLDEAWLAPFAKALGEDAAAFACPLLGGDTVSTPGPAMISITAFGRVPKGKMVHRHGAKPGELVVVSGTIGDAALGLLVLKDDTLIAQLDLDDAAVQHVVARYRVPQPRTALALAIREYASGAMDVSDGLAGDLAKLCSASGVSAHVDATLVPVSGIAAVLIDQRRGIQELLISGGDDYEVLCTIPENRWPGFQRAAQQAGVAVTTIGRTVQGSSAPVFLLPDGRPLELKSPSYSHF